MAQAELVDGRISVDVPHREKSLILQVPGARWDQKTLRWRVPLSWAACKQLRGVFGDKLEVGPALAAWAQLEFDGRVAPALRVRAAALDPSAECVGWLPGMYPYQQTGAQFLGVAGSAILGDDLGVGKTITGLAVIGALDGPALVVCPKSVQYEWARAASRWLGLDALVVEGSAVKRRKQLAEPGSAELVIVTWDQLRTHSRLAPYGSIALSADEKTPKELNAWRFGVVMADEAHRGKDAKAKQTRALWAIGDKAQHRFALTGTPIADNIADLWSLLRFVAPEEWPSRTAYLDRYALVSLNYWGGAEVLGLNPSTEAEFRELVDARFVRRPKSLVLPHLPKKVYVRRDVAMSPKQAKAYRQLADGMVAALDSGTLTTFSPLVNGMRLTQFASASCELVETGEVDQHGVPVQSVRMTEPSSKLDELDNILEELGGAPVAVFAASRQLLDLAAVRLDKRGVPYAQIVGGMHALERQDQRDRFNKGDADIILISLGAGAEGVSLTRGSTEIFLDRSWSQLQNEQAEARMHGTGRGDHSADSLTIIDLVAVGTRDEHRIVALQDKTERAEEFLQDRAAIRAALEWGK